MGGGGSKQRRVFRALRFIHYLPFRVLSFRGTTHVDATQPSTSRTIEVQFLAPLAADTLTAGHMWRIASVTRSTIFPSEPRLTFGIPRTPSVEKTRNPRARAQTESFHLPSFNIADVQRVSNRELSNNLKVYSERRSF